MDEKPILIIKSSETTIQIIAKYRGNFAEHEIQLRSVIGYYWNKDIPVIEKFLELFEKVIKRTIDNVYPNEKLSIKYNLKSNDALEESSELYITFLEIKVDDKEVELEGEVLVLEGFDLRGTFSKITSFRRKLDETITKEIYSEKIAF